MPTPFDAYANTARGQRLVAIVNDPARYPEYRCFSREGWPAVTALVSLVRPHLEPLRRTDPKQFAAAKQFVGWAVGQVMRQHGHNIVGRCRVPGRLFTMGAIWSATPIRSPGSPPAAATSISTQQHRTESPASALPA